MEKKNSPRREDKALITELFQGLRMAELLRGNLNLPTSPLLLTNLLSSFDKAIHLLQFTPPQNLPPNNGSFNIHPHTLDSSQSFNLYKKRLCFLFFIRKVAPLCTQNVKIYSKNPERHIEDGFSWKKYGQKDILGSTFPRGYYRCSHMQALGCTVTKQVQRSDNYPSLIEITYRGEHACLHTSSLSHIGSRNNRGRKAVGGRPPEKRPEKGVGENTGVVPGVRFSGFGRWLIQSPILYVVENLPPPDIDTSFSFDLVDLFT